MSTFDFRPPAGWAPLEAETSGAVLERVASDRGRENPTISIRMSPAPASVDEIPGITPSELRGQGFDSVEVVQQQWHSPEGAYPYVNQMLRAERTTPEGRREEIGASSVHILMSDEADPARKQLLSFELRFRRDDDVDATLREFGDLVASTTTVE